MGMIGMGNECYLYVNGISVSKPIWLHDTVCISPAKSAIKWKEVMPLFENDIDFSIAVLCNPTIASQLHIIGDDTEHLIANAWNSQWDCVLLGALFNHNAMCNLQSDQPIEQIAKAEYIHITNYELRALLSGIYNISEEDELWLEKYYKTAYKLLEKDSFQTAVHTMASYRWHSVPRVQLAVIWSGIESLFNANTEVSFRISLYIANFLEAMNFRHDDSLGHSAGHISNKTLYIALNYEEQAERMNAESAHEIAKELFALECEQRRLTYFIGLLDKRQAEVIRLVFVDGIPTKEVAASFGLTYRTIDRIKRTAIENLVEMYAYSDQFQV